MGDLFSMQQMQMMQPQQGNLAQIIPATMMGGLANGVSAGAQGGGFASGFSNSFKPQEMSQYNKALISSLFGKGGLY